MWTISHAFLASFSLSFLFASTTLFKSSISYKYVFSIEIEHLNYLLTATLNKILHKPFMNLKEHATDNDKYSIAEAMNIIFKNN